MGVAKPGKRTAQPILPFLVDYSNDLGNNLASRDRIAPLMKRVDELETYLDPLFGEETTMSDTTKLNIVSSQEAQLNNNLNILAKIEALKPALQSNKLVQVSELAPKMAELSRLQVDQSEQVGEMTQQTLDLVNKYNSIIASLTDAFLQADLVVRRAEQEKNKPKIIN